MELFPLFSAVLVVAALFGWLNHRFLRLPATIGVMAISLAFSVVLIVLDRFGIPVRAPAVRFLEDLHFREAVLDCMLAFLLFAGALHVDLGRLLGQKRVVGILATAGVLLTTLLVGVLFWGAARTLGVEAGLGPCLLFGALIAPTDPIAVLGILRSAGVPPSVETKIAGESLFNDGIGIVVFTLLLGSVAGAGHGPDGVGGVLLFFAREAAGSVALGLACGWIVFRLLRSVDGYQIEVMLTLALAAGLYTLALVLHCSGPLAVVTAGLMIGNTGRSLAMSETTRERLTGFWELLDEILNLMLFVLIGLEILVVELSPRLLGLGALAVGIVLFSRFVSVSGTVLALRRLRPFSPGAVRLLTWGGLRGAISVALALSIPASVPGRDLILTTTYVVVVFSILVQGLTIAPLARRLAVA